MFKNLKYNADKSGLHKKIKVVENKKRMLLILLLKTGEAEKNFLIMLTLMNLLIFHLKY